MSLIIRFVSSKDMNSTSYGRLRVGICPHCLRLCAEEAWLVEWPCSAQSRWADMSILYRVFGVESI
jgi:hypothetical protein